MSWEGLACHCGYFWVSSSVEVAIPPAAVSIKIFTRLLIRTFSDVEKSFIISDLAPNQKIKKTFQRQRRLGLPGLLADLKLTCTIALRQLITAG